MMWDWWAQPASLAIAFYRFGHAGQASTSLWRRALTDVAYRIVHPVVEGWSGVTLPRETTVGRGLRIFHRGKVVINGAAVIGRNCSLVHGVTIGNRVPDGPCPVIGDDVEIGAYAQILGPVHIGDGAKIGSLAVVVDDVPAGATVVGQKAQVIMSTVLPSAPAHQSPIASNSHPHGAKEPRTEPLGEQ
jgi:serine O-acetyltransferase